MPQLEPLNLRITGDPRGLSQALGRSSDETRRFAGGLDAQAGRLKTGLSGIAAGFGPITLAAGAAFAAITAGAGAAVAGISKLRDLQRDIDETAKSADKLGLAFNDLGGLRLAISESSGLDEGAIDSALERMLINLAEAEQGAGKASESLAKLGLDAGKLIQAGPVEALKQIATETQKLQNSTEQLKVAYDIFGRTGAGAVSTLRGGADAIAEAVAFQERWNGLTEQQVSVVEAMNDTFGRIGIVISGTLQELAAEAAPVFKLIGDEILSLLESLPILDGGIRKLIDGFVYAAGLAYDVYELITVQSRIAREIMDDLSGIVRETLTPAFEIAAAVIDQFFEDLSDSLNQIADFFGGFGESKYFKLLEEAFSFDTGDKLLSRINEIRNAFDDVGGAGANEAQIALLEKQAEVTQQSAEVLTKAVDSLKVSGATSAVLRGTAEDLRLRYAHDRFLSAADEKKRTPVITEQQGNKIIELLKNLNDQARKDFPLEL